MPELPEVEYYRRRLSAFSDGVRISAVRINEPNRRLGITSMTFQKMVGAHIDEITRRGKFLILSLSDKSAVVIHLGMSGRLVHRIPDKRHDLFGLCFGKTAWLTYNDFRRFGRVWRVPQEETDRCTPVGDLGPEPLSRQFNSSCLVLKSRRSVKDVLLDQHVVAGIGNIYACESLYRSGIHPARAVVSLTEAERIALVRAIKATLRSAIQRGGSTLNDYRHTEGKAGDFDRYFAVYAKEGDPCPKCTCSSGVGRIMQHGRSTFFCSTLQR